MKVLRCLTLVLMLFTGGQIGFNLRRYGYANVPPGGPPNQAPTGAPAPSPSMPRPDEWCAGLGVPSRPPLRQIPPLNPQLSRVERRHAHLHPPSLFNPPPPPTELAHLRFSLGGQTFFEGNKENLPSIPVRPRPAGPVLAPPLMAGGSGGLPFDDHLRETIVHGQSGALREMAATIEFEQRRRLDNLTHQVQMS